MRDPMITVQAMQDIKSKVYCDDKKNLPLAALDQLVLVGAVASNKEEEIVFENSSSALEALRKLNALKIFCPRDDDDGHSDELRVEFSKGTKKEIMNHTTERGFNSKSTWGCKKARAFESKKPENLKYSQPLSTQQRDLPEEFKRKLETTGGGGGCSDEARLVIQKELYCSDLAIGANRLSIMPINQVTNSYICSFLEKNEVEWLERPGRELPALIDPMIEEEQMCLTRWNYPKSNSHVLRSRWNHVEDNKDWCLKPKPKNMKIKKGKGLGFKEHNRAPRYSTDPNDLPEDLKRKIETLEGIESFEKARMIMVMEKHLFETDLTYSANRLSMPLKQIKPESFLDEDEIRLLASQQDWPVSVISPKLEDENLTFRQWNMTKNNGTISSSYVLKTGWNELHKKNGLKRNDVIQVWSFRDMGNNLHFAFVLVEKATEAEPAGSGGDFARA